MKLETRCTVPHCMCFYHREHDARSTRHFGLNSESRRGNNFNGKSWDELLRALKSSNSNDRLAALAAAEFQLAIFSPESYDRNRLGRMWVLSTSDSTKEVINIVVEGRCEERFTQENTLEFVPRAPEYTAT